MKAALHTRGCSPSIRRPVIQDLVCLTYAGIYLSLLYSTEAVRQLPHMRGDLPPRYSEFHRSIIAAPHAWGCASGKAVSLPGLAVCPTYAGIYHKSSEPGPTNSSLPHIRGDLPRSHTSEHDRLPSAPRTRGCSRMTDVYHRTTLACPAHAGMFLRISISSAACWCLPACLAHAGMFLIRFCHGPLCSCLPHMRGDLPDLWKEAVEKAGPAPRAWGCTRRSGIHSLQLPTRPANAGMYLCCTPPTRR